MCFDCTALHDNMRYKCPRTISVAGMSWAEQRGGIDYVATRKEQKAKLELDPVNPTANMSEQVALALHMLDQGDEIDQDDVKNLAELVIAFVEWRQKGGADANWSAVPTDGLDE
jgi:hypothetical protein